MQIYASSVTRPLARAAGTALELELRFWTTPFPPPLFLGDLSQHFVLLKKSCIRGIVRHSFVDDRLVEGEGRRPFGALARPTGL